MKLNYSLILPMVSLEISEVLGDTATAADTAKVFIVGLGIENASL